VFCGTLAKVPSQCTDELWESNFSRVGVVKPIFCDIFPEEFQK